MQLRVVETSGFECVEEPYQERTKQAPNHA